MVLQVSEVVAQMRAALALSEPDLDTTIGTPVRKILDAVAEAIAEASVDKHLLSYQYDIDAKTGEDLDDFVELFGFTRFPAKRAVGSVVFERQTAATQAILIPVNTQLSTEGIAPLVVQTTTPALMLPGEASVSVPVQAVVGGSQGNITANSLRRRLTPLEGINSFTNTTALSGGADEESDEQLRTRFKRTIFRNMAGTESMFLGIALDDESVTQANVIGATKTHRESIEIVAGVGTSTLVGASYVYPNSETFGSDIDNGVIFTPNVHYTFDTGTLTITSIDGTVVPDGVYDLTFDYVPSASRNDPANGITNRVDVYVNGTRATEATEDVVFRQARVFNNTPNDPLNVANFQREDGSAPVAGNYFVAFAFSPVTDPAVSDVITIDAVNYTQDTDFFLVNDITNEGLTPGSLSGIEFVSLANGGADPTDLSIFVANYLFNAVPRDIEEAVSQWRLLTTDVKVHQAKPILLNFHLAIILEPGYAFSSVVSQLQTDLSNFVATIGFNGVVQVSDILEVAALVPGVDAVRFLTDSDNGTNFAIQRVNSLGAVQETYSTDVVGQVKRAIDVVLSDDQYPIFNNLVVVQKAQNTFGPV